MISRQRRRSITNFFKPWLPVIFFGMTLGAAAQLPDLAVPDGFGVNIHFTDRPADLDRIAAGGLKFVRADLIWEAVEKEKGVYDFATPGYDALAQGCASRALRIMFILDYGNALYEPEKSVRTERGRRAFASFAKAAAARYAGQGILWEIWNEPNGKDFWSPQPSDEDYVRLVRAAQVAIKQADPAAMVLGGSLGGTSIKLEWLGKCFQHGLLDVIDALTVHPYRSWRRRAPEAVIEEYAALRQLMSRYAPEGKDVPVISGEWGWSLHHFDGAQYSEEQQAQFLVRMLLINLSQRIPLSIWYKWRNGGDDPLVKSHNYGIVTHASEPKLAYFALKTLAETLDGYGSGRRLDTGSALDFVLQFQNGEKQAYAIWAIGAGDNEPAALLEADVRSEVAIALPPGEGVLVSMLGNRTRLAWGEGGAKILASRSPQYLLLQDP